ncbi:MAG: response regulator [Zoogloeaceae bacterium]|jgi:putative two-component system response regulator|nr:response regulator [Zoogloeaceae bacterium]
MEKRAKIMLVDDDMSVLAIGKNMLKDRYEVYPLPSAAKLFETLAHVLPDMILLDIEMPEMNGYEAMRRLRADSRLYGVPVIFVTARADERSELEGLSMGAIDYVSKPFSAPLLLKRVENHLLTALQKQELARYNTDLQGLVRQQTGHIVDLQNSVLCTVSNLIEFRDDVTGGHINRTREYLRLLIEALARENLHREKVARWDMNFLLPSSQLHDVGKIAISDAILNKPGKLTPEEFEIMKTHVVIGMRIIERIEQNTAEHAFLRYAKVFVATHHEKWDGSGYPLGLSGEDIPLEGRLMAIADVYDALISRRSYKPPLAAAKAERIIVAGGGTHFDPSLTEIFQKVSDGFAEIAAQGIRRAPTPSEVS